MRIPFLLKKKFRTASFYRLVEWNQLNQRERDILAGLSDEQEVYGVFRPVRTSSQLTSKVAYYEVALLYFHLQQSDVLPRYLITWPKERLNETIVQLVLDGILEIESNDNFVSGAAAVHAIFGNTVFKNAPLPDRLSDLSMKAIRYALLLRNSDIRSIANRLYSFNTIPYDAVAKSEFFSSRTVKEFLFLNTNGEHHNFLNKNWTFINNLEKKAWLVWSSSNSIQKFSTSPNSYTFKLYISPGLRELPEVFQQTVYALSESNAVSFKIGNSPHGLLRPDKMVAYFENFEDLKKGAARLEKKIAGCAVQGVPFTCQIDKTGLLSWGVDPPESDVLEAIEGGSWRTKITDQLAIAILQAQTERLSMSQTIDFIQAKLAATGINVTDWTPMNHFFDLPIRE